MSLARETIFKVQRTCEYRVTADRRERPAEGNTLSLRNSKANPDIYAPCSAHARHDREALEPNERAS